MMEGMYMTYIKDGNVLDEYYRSNDIGLAYTDTFNHWMTVYDPCEAKRIPSRKSREVLIGRIWEPSHGVFWRTLDFKTLLSEVNVSSIYKGKRKINYRIYTYNNDGEEHYGTTREAVTNAILMGYRYIALRDTRGVAYAVIDTWIEK